MTMTDLAKTLIDKLRVNPGERIRLRDRNPRDKSLFGDEQETKADTADLAKGIDALQDRLYAEGSQALLVILQGTDTSGKDGTIRSVFNATGPLGIFNRSHYEDVLIGKVRKFAPEAVIEQRYEQINAFEKMLVENGTTILKFMLHISKDEQKERLQARLDDPTKNWKFNPGDLEDREHWDDYQDAYETMLHRCSTAWAPWHVIPADRKWVRNAAIANIVKATLEEMNPQYPQVSWDPKDFAVR
jgi:polyphosphate kinase 2 (PPK2 family)